MSLTSFLKNQDVREAFARQFPKPKFSPQKEILAPPLSKRYSLIGTAFDYLLRFRLKRLNPDAVTTRWVAEWSISSPRSPLLEDVVFNANTGKISFTETDLARRAGQIIEQAKTAYDSYLSSGEITDEVIESCLCLAQLDPIYRSGYVDENMGIVHSEDVADLRNLVSIVNPEIFRAKELCMLNPTFGEGSRLVGGADADLLIDDVLIDIKTTKNLRLTRDDFNQIMGYYVLFRISGVDNVPHPPTIGRVGIYYSRYGELFMVPIQDVVDDETLPRFIDWFKERAAN